MSPLIYNIYLAESILFSINPGTFEPVIVLVVVHAKPVLVVISVGPDEDVTSLRRVVTTSAVEMVFLERSFVKVSVLENLEVDGSRR